MITDIFARRYEAVLVRKEYFKEDLRFMHQMSEMISARLWLGYKPEKKSEQAEKSIKAVHDALALELGTDYLSPRFFPTTTTYNGNTNTHYHTRDYGTVCKNFLEQVPKDTSNADGHIKERLSLV